MATKREEVYGRGIAGPAIEHGVPVWWRLVAVGLGLVLLVAAPRAAAQDVRVQEAYALPRLSGPVELDGFSDEAAWAEVEPLPVTMYQPTFEGEPTEQTEIRVAYTDDHLYAAGCFYDSEPGGIRSNSLYRDRYSGDDTFALILDTFNDNENARWFYTSPAGVRFDAAVTNDAEFIAGRPVNDNWNTHWDVATARTADGWFAEMRIPYSSLGFQASGDRVTMGLIAYRYIARKNERHVFPAIPPNWSMGYAKPSVARDVALYDVASQRPVYVTPYVLSGYQAEAALNASETAYHTTDAWTRDLGLDVKLNLTSTLTLDATANTDFAQAEADAQQVNLSRFSLFFPEKRPFFQERAGLFAFTFDGPDRLFHSRRIGLSEDGEPVRILGGARLVGRVGAWDVGLLDLQTARTSALDLPSENVGVLRVRRRVLNPYSTAGAMVTSRIGFDGSTNLAMGLDGVLRYAEDRYLTLKWSHTYDDATQRTDAPAFFDTGRFYARLDNSSRRGVGYTLSLSRIGSAYAPDLGFATRQNITSATGWIRYGVFPGDTSPFRWLTPGIWGGVFLRNDDGTVESAGVDVWFYGERKTGGSVNPWASFGYEDVREAFELAGGVEVPTGSYRFVQANAGFEMAEGRLLRTGANVGVGSFYDGWRLNASVEPTWNASRHLELSSRYQINVLRFPDRDQQATIHLAQLRVQAALNTRLSATAFVQLNSAADLVATNLRIRYNVAEGNDLWIVYNEGLNTERHELDTANGRPLRLPRSDARTILLKYTHTFQL